MAHKPQEKPPAFPWYARDWLACARVARMTLEEKGAYATLLSYAWMEGGVPDDPRALAGMLGCTTAKARKLMAGVLGECWHTGAENPQKLFNPRQEKERKKQRAYKAQKSNSGRKGAEARWHTHKKEDGKRIANDGSATASASAFAEETPPTPPGESVHQVKISRMGRFLKHLPSSHRADDALISSLEEWITYRAQLHKPLTPLTITRQAKKLGEVMPHEAIEALERSIENGWTKIVFTENGSHGNSARPQSSFHRQTRSAREFPESNALPTSGARSGKAR